jgi:hypothetical protein
MFMPKSNLSFKSNKNQPHYQRIEFQKIISEAQQAPRMLLLKTHRFSHTKFYDLGKIDS